MARVSQPVTEVHTHASMQAHSKSMQGTHHQVDVAKAPVLPRRGGHTAHHMGDGGGTEVVLRRAPPEKRQHLVRIAQRWVTTRDCHDSKWLMSTSGHAYLSFRFLWKLRTTSKNGTESRRREEVSEHAILVGPGKIRLARADARRRRHRQRIKQNIQYARASDYM